MSDSIETSEPEPLNGEAIVAGLPISIRQGKALLPKGWSVVQTSYAAIGETTRTNSRPRKVRVDPIPLKTVKRSPSYEPQAIAVRVIEVLGNNVAAGLLGVAKDRPSRWAAGTDRPSNEGRARLADLDALLGHLLAVFTPEQASLWLEGIDPHLNARPVDVFRLEGSGRLLDAMRAYEQGAFA